MWWITPPANPPYELSRLKRERLIRRFEKLSRG
jgi:hypothetical protein